MQSPKLCHCIVFTTIPSVALRFKMFHAFHIMDPNDVVEWLNIPAMLGNIKLSSFFPLVLDNASAVGFEAKHGLLVNSRNW